MKFNIGDKIRFIKKNSIHLIESIETIANQTVIFTEDSKCFPVEEITINYDSFVSEFFIKVFSGQTPTIDEEQKLQEILKKMNLACVKKN